MRAYTLYDNTGIYVDTIYVNNDTQLMVQLFERGWSEMHVYKLRRVPQISLNRHERLGQLFGYDSNMKRYREIIYISAPYKGHHNTVTETPFCRDDIKVYCSSH